MPPYKSLRTLQDICIEWLLEWIFQSLKVDAPPKERLLKRKYITSCMSANIKQRLLNIIFQQHMYEQNLTSKCMMLEVLGDKGTQCVDFTLSGYAYIDEVWHLYRTLTIGLMINLTRLGIICNLRSASDKKYLADVNSSFYRVFNQMKSLRWVTLASVADNQILCTLGMNCAHLEYLNIADSWKVDDEAIANLVLSDPLATRGRSLRQLGLQDLKANACAKTLKRVCVSGTNISDAGVLILLHYVTNLESFGTSDACSITSVIECLQPEDGHRLFNIKELFDAKILPHQASLLNMVCPKLTHLDTDSISIESLHIIDSISSLTLNLSFKELPIDFYNYLCDSGSNLTELILVDHINSQFDIQWFTELTPNLERLEATLYQEDDEEFPNWPHLRVAKVNVESSQVLVGLLTHAPVLRDLDINFSKLPYSESFECINDDLIINVAVAGGLTHLQKLRISECAITFKGIECLLLHCPDLRYLAPLAFWYGVKPKDIDELDRQIKENNWNLTLIMRADWENKRKALEMEKDMETCNIQNGIES